jgi:phosphate acetyltransferase
VASSIYLAGTGRGSGKSAIALGLLDQAIRRLPSVAVFRPLVRSGDASTGTTLDLLLSRLPAPPPRQDCIGVTYQQMHDDPDRAMATIVERYHQLAARHQAVLVVGSDFTDVGAPTEFSVNARIAANLGSPMLLVASGHGLTPDEIRGAAELAVEDVHHNHALVLGVVANRVAPEDLEATRDALAGVAGTHPVYAVPAHPQLPAPSVRDQMTAAGGRLLYGDDSLLDREATGVLIGAMTLPNILGRLSEGAVLITPADRADVLLGVLLAHHSRTFPSLAGIVLNGDLQIDPQIHTIVEGLKLSLPVIEVTLGTADTARVLGAVTGRITRTSERKIQTAIALVDEAIDGTQLLREIQVAPAEVVTPVMFEHRLVERARQADRHIVLPEGEEDRILIAADQLLRRKVARLTLLGDPDLIRAKAQRLQLDLAGADILTDPLRDRFAREMVELRKAKGVTYDLAWDSARDVSYFGTMMVHDGLADGMVSGSVNTTAHTIRPALQLIKTRPGVSVVSSVFLMCLADRVLAYGDCAVNPDPTAEQLADIAISSAATAHQFGIEPRVAMLSYSTGSSGSGADVEKVRRATDLVRERAPELPVDGPIQYDAAVDPAVAATKATGSPVAGRATVLIFPDLNTGNNTYKAVQRSAGAIAIGPILQGLRQPVNDLSRGALVPDIVNTVAITAIQAAGR